MQCQLKPQQDFLKMKTNSGFQFIWKSKGTRRAKASLRDGKTEERHYRFQDLLLKPQESRQYGIDESKDI